MTEDIRKLLRDAEGPSNDLDAAIVDALGLPRHLWSPSRDYTISIKYIEEQGCDWIMANVNGQVGGTPHACVGVPEDQASFAATPLLSLWLSYFRFQLGNEREEFQDRNPK